MLSQVAASKSRWKKDPQKIKSAVFIYFFLVGGDENEPSVSVENPPSSQRKQLKPAKLGVFNLQRMLGLLPLVTETEWAGLGPDLSLTGEMFFFNIYLAELLFLRVLSARL